MKRKIILLIFLIGLSLFSCNRGRDPEVVFEQYDQLSSLDRQTETTSSFSETQGNLIDIQNIAYSSPPKINIPSDLPHIQTLNMNIDTDESDEQIILVKENNEINARFKILIADYLQVFEYYVLSSEQITQATKVQSFQISLMDVDNDKLLEIVCVGYDNDDHQTIDIFKYDPKSTITGLKYYSILSISSSGSLDINQDSNSGAVTIERQHELDPSSDSIIKETFAWRTNTRLENKMGSFVAVSYQNIRKERIDDIELRKIIQARNQSVKQSYLNGIWELQNDSKIKTYLIFDFEENRFIIYTDAFATGAESNADVYIYQRYRRLYYNRSQITGKSGIHDFKYIRINFTYQTMNSIKVDVFDNDSSIAKDKVNENRSGLFTRVNESKIKDILKSRKQEKELPKISGIYIQRPDHQYLFEEPFFRLKYPDDSIVKGGYIIYNSNVPIMEMHYFDANGSIVQKKCYKFDYEENITGRKRFKTITLTPGKITLHGFRANDDDTIQLQNEEFMSE